MVNNGHCDKIHVPKLLKYAADWNSLDTKMPIVSSLTQYNTLLFFE